MPNIGGDLYFEEPYETNCLVNAMAIGLVRKETLTLSAATGPGNIVVLFGASTGRDGIGGASVMASAELARTMPISAPPCRWAIRLRRRR